MRNGVWLGLLFLLCVTPAWSARYDDAQQFIGEMLRGVDATRIDCPNRVVEETSSRDMGVVCAMYEGDFESFVDRWTLHVGDVVPSSEPRTSWEARSGAHERIYSVGGAAVGVRFFSGTLTFVYK